jgi:hypothetical protein
MGAMKQVLVESESPEAKRDAISWLLDRAVNVVREHPDWAEGCIKMAYDVDEDIAAEEMGKRKQR